MAIANHTGTRAFFAKRLRELRLPRGFRTARKLAQELGIDENRYTRYERAEVEPDLDLLVRIAEVLEVTPNDLLGVVRADESPAGFAESHAGAGGGGGHGASSSPYSGSSMMGGYLHEGQPESGVVEDVQVRRQAHMWALAREMVLTIDEDKLDKQYNCKVRASGGSGQLQRIAILYKVIERDTFGFVSQFSLSPLLTTLPIEQQDRFAKLIERVTSVPPE